MPNSETRPSTLRLRQRPPAAPIPNPYVSLSAWATGVDFIGTLLIALSAGRTLVGYLRHSHKPPVVAWQQYGLAAMGSGRFRSIPQPD